jgi:phage replication-related protein YjqB (UPF0714/DUF867 family)
MNSWYKNFAELSAIEKQGLSFRLQVKDRGTSFAVVAPHGGGIEPGTSEIAKTIAGRSFSLYTFDGIRLRGNELLHITSTLFDEPRCLNLVKNSNTAVTIHGCRGDEQVVYIGGLDVELGEQIIHSFGEAGVEAVRSTTQFLGNQSENICNRGRSGRGVQLEITEGLRRSMFKGLGRENRRITKPAFQVFVNAIRKVLLSQTGK